MLAINYCLWYIIVLLALVLIYDVVLGHQLMIIYPEYLMSHTCRDISEVETSKYVW